MTEMNWIPIPQALNHQPPPPRAFEQSWAEESWSMSHVENFMPLSILNIQENVSNSPKHSWTILNNPEQAWKSPREKNIQTGTKT